MSIEETIKAARGQKPADLLIRNARVVDVVAAEIYAADVAVHGGRVIGFGSYESHEVTDLEGRYLCPGFIDGHLHIESTMLTPPEFARAVLPHGTAAVVTDPHEIANVLGVEGIDYMLNASSGLPVTVYVMLPSCVPATALETSGAVLSADDLEPLLNRDRVLGIAEVMNYPGVLAADPEVLKKIKIARGRPVDGHAPGLSGKDLCAYIAAGIHSDHECTTAAEASEKLRLGMHIMVREGSTEKNLKELVSIVTPENSRRFMLVTDDRHPEDLIAEGHMDFLVRRAIEEGISPVMAVQMASINAAGYFGITGTGAVAPGYRADFSVLADLEKVRVSRVFKGGRLVAEGGEALPFPPPSSGSAGRDTIIVDDRSLTHLPVKAEGARMKVIGIVPGQIVTEKLVVEPRVEGGMAVSDPERDILKLVVVERHHASGNVGLGFVKGMGLKGGAIASSVAHDSHNIIAAGVADADIRAAVIEIERLGGGAVVIDGGRVLAALPLPVAGLMSERPVGEVAAAAREVIGAARNMGCALDDPLITLSFLALPVVPELKLTDKGLVDVGEFRLVGLFE